MAKVHWMHRAPRTLERLLDKVSVKWTCIYIALIYLKFKNEEGKRNSENMNIGFLDKLVSHEEYFKIHIQIFY